jgi:hypothetical protein
MKAFTAILQREVRLRSGLLPLALIVGLTPWLSPALGVDRGAVATVMVIVVGAMAIVLTGASVIASDLADGRLGFLFARPIPWWSIWGAKMLAALLLTAASLALVFLPAFVAGDLGLDGGGWIGTRLVPTVLAALGAVHFAAVAYRSRDAWVALDVVALGAAGAGAAALASVVEANGFAMQAGDEMIVAASWALALVFVTASAVQVWRGRGDVVRGHFLLSVVVWSGIASILGGAGIVVARALRPAPSDVARIRTAVPIPRGSWISVGGPTGGSLTTWPQFVLDTVSGRWIRTGDFGFHEPALSTDGRWVVWSERGWTSRRPGHVAVADLQSPDLAVRRWPWPPGAEDGLLPLTVTPGGEQALVAAGPRAYWIDLRTGGLRSPASTASGTLAAAVAIDGLRARALRVRAGDPRGAGRADVVEVGLDAERLLGTLAFSGRPIARWTSDGSGLLLTERGARGDSRVVLYDGANAAPRAVLVERGSARAAAADFLGDGRVAVVVTAEDTRLIIATRDGVPERTVVLDATPRTGNTVAELGPGLVGVTLGGASLAQLRSVVVDAATGTVRREEPGLRLANGWAALFGGVRLEGARPLFLTRESLVEVDLTTGARRTVLGAP